MTRSPRERRVVAGWLWNTLLLALALAALTVLTLAIALTAGWNSPRPGRQPDWEARTLPHRVAVPAGEHYTFLFGETASDFTLEVAASPKAGPETSVSEYGLIYRAQDLANFYALLVGADGYFSVVQVQGGRETLLTPWNQFPHIRRGQQENRFLVTCNNSTCEFRLNDEYATAVESDQWLSGDVGLYARSPNGETSVRFIHARLWLPIR